MMHGVVRYYWFFEAWQDKEPALDASTMAFAVSCLYSGALVRRYVAVAIQDRAMRSVIEGAMNRMYVS